MFRRQVYYIAEIFFKKIIQSTADNRKLFLFAQFRILVEKTSKTREWQSKTVLLFSAGPVTRCVSQTGLTTHATRVRAQSQRKRDWNIIQRVISM